MSQLGALGAAVQTAIETGISNAVVAVGTVTISDNDAQYTPDEIFTDYAINNRYEKDDAKYMAGLTSPGSFGGQSVAFFQLHTPTLLWVSDWTAEKLNGIPDVPDPDAVDDSWELLDSHVELADIKFLPDGVTPVYRVSGTYVYGNKNPSDSIFSDVVFGISPEFKTTPPRTISLQDLDKSISVPEEGSSPGDVAPGMPGKPDQKNFGG